ncbi:MAG: amino acid permease [Kiritimatiellae bacterium]|nr:amino acid permease [Kiritimatiellia bacterium]
MGKEDTDKKKRADADVGGYRFGTFKGVFTPSVLTILGVVMYLRFGWALGHMGLARTLLIVTMASGITFLTGLSLSALATNMKVKGGGAYFIISRSLGIEAGAAVGLPLFFAQALGISFYVAGFSESLIGEFPGCVPRLMARLGMSESLVTMAGEFDIQIIGVVTLLLLTAVAYKSANLALKSQFVVMAIIFTSLISYFFGGTPEDVPAVSGAVTSSVKFWAVFAVIFPAVTGIEAGIAMSGDLKDPAKSLPRGTISAVLVGYVVYVAVVVFLWSVVQDKELLIGCPMIMRYVARWGGPILLGIWAASLSSAMGALLGAPRTLQALAKDRVIPAVFGRGYGVGNDPRLATATAFLVGLAGVLLGDLNMIAVVLTMFFLTSYGLLNVSAGLEELANVPSWRPKFRVPWMVSILGAFACFAAMFMISAGATFVAAFVAIAVYVLMQRRSLNARWGDMRSALLMLIARFAIQGLSKRKLDERTWMPNILVLSGAPTGRWHLIELASAISLDRGFLAVAAIVPDDTTAERIESMSSTVYDYLEKRDVQSVVRVYPAETPMDGAKMLVKTYGYGPITPNTILLGMSERPENYLPFSELVLSVSARHQNLVVMREGEEEEPDVDNRRIDLWWYGTQQNLGFMLALAYLLKRSSAWNNATLMLRSIVNNEAEVAETQAQLNGFIEKVRLDATADVFVRKSDDIFEDIKESSRGAGLVFLGIRGPKDDETPEMYSTYYEDLLARTNDLPPAAFVLAAEEMDFYAIFDE